jgi:hypothetical protein
MNTFEQAAQVRYYRQAFADMPVGGPMEGAAYGEYLKSKGVGMVIGIVAAVATMGAGIGVMAAGTLAAQLSGGAMIAGGLMSGIGAVTGNKKLTKIGGVLALAGGIGAIGSSFATEAGWGGAFAKESGSSAITEFANSTKSVFSNIFTGSSETAGKEIAVEGGSTIDSDIQGTPVEGPAYESSGSIAQSMSGTPTADAFAPTKTAMPLSDSVPAGTLELSGGTTNPSFATPDQAAIASGGASAPQDATSQFGQTTKKFATPDTSGSATAPAATESKGLLAQAWDKLNSPLGKEMAMGALKMAGTSLAGDKESAENLADAQSGLYKAKTDQTNVETELAKMKAANANAVPIALDPRDPQYAAKKAAAQAAGYQTFDIATPAATAPVTRAPVQTQYTSSPTKAA